MRKTFPVLPKALSLPLHPPPPLPPLPSAQPQTLTFFEIKRENPFRWGLMDRSNDLRRNNKKEINFFASEPNLHCKRLHPCVSSICVRRNLELKKIKIVLNMKVIHFSTFTNSSFNKINIIRHSCFWRASKTKIFARLFSVS